MIHNYVYYIKCMLSGVYLLHSVVLVTYTRKPMFLLPILVFPLLGITIMFYTLVPFPFV